VPRLYVHLMQIEFFNNFYSDEAVCTRSNNRGGAHGERELAVINPKHYAVSVQLSDK